MTQVLRLKAHIRDDAVRIDIPSKVALFNPNAPSAHFTNYVKGLYGMTQKDQKRARPRAHRNTLYYQGKSERTSSALRLPQIAALGHQAPYWRHETVFIQDETGRSPWHLDPDDIYLTALSLGGDAEDIIVVHYDEQHLHYHRLYQAHRQSTYLNATLTLKDNHE